MCVGVVLCGEWYASFLQVMRQYNFQVAVEERFKAPCLPDGRTCEVTTRKTGASKDNKEYLQLSTI